MYCGTSWTTLMSKHRWNAGNNLVDKKEKFFKNPNIHPKYKQAFIKNVLIPTLTYGCELYGLNDTRAKKLKECMDKAIKYIIGDVNFRREATYKIFKINSIQWRLKPRKYLLGSKF